MPISRFAVSMLLPMLVALVSAGCGREETASVPVKAADADRCPHEIRADKCPFCTPALIAADGFCYEHGVAEALCAECRPYLKAAFRAKGDWCDAHKAPDSQCVACHPELKDKMKPGSGHGGAAPGVTPPTTSPG
jgi:hypothetical protein